MPGSGPRHFTFHPNNKKVFVINELGGSVLSYDLGTPRNFALSPDGKFLFVANQDTNNIATLKINDDGSLSDTGHNLNIPSPVCIKFL